MSTLARFADSTQTLLQDREVPRSRRRARQRPVLAFTRPEATAVWNAAKSRSFWSAYVSANEAIARSK